VPDSRRLDGVRIVSGVAVARVNTRTPSRALQECACSGTGTAVSVPAGCRPTVASRSSAVREDAVWTPDGVDADHVEGRSIGGLGALVGGTTSPTITDEAYERLDALERDDESFTDTILRLTG
jgi:hypothetical protein